MCCGFFVNTFIDPVLEEKAETEALEKWGSDILNLCSQSLVSADSNKPEIDDTMFLVISNGKIQSPVYSRIPDERLADDQSELDYLICEFDVDEVIKTCYYTGDHTFEVIRQKTKVHVIDLSSRKIIKDETFVGSKPETNCPEEIPGNMSREGLPADLPDSYIDWLFDK
jgi:hypothetical protein